MYCLNVSRKLCISGVGVYVRTCPILCLPLALYKGQWLDQHCSSIKPSLQPIFNWSNTLVINNGDEASSQVVLVVLVVNAILVANAVSGGQRKSWWSTLYWWSLALVVWLDQIRADTVPCGTTLSETFNVSRTQRTRRPTWRSCSCKVDAHVVKEDVTSAGEGVDLGRHVQVTPWMVQYARILYCVQYWEGT